MATKETKKYIEGIGRRKRAIARVRITPGGKGKFVINDEKDVEGYFPNEELQLVTRAALSEVKKEKSFDISVHVRGGGKRAQAEAIRLGTARALVEHDNELRDDLKKAGYLKRDARVKERKKFGLKKARKAPQWSKR